MKKILLFLLLLSVGSFLKAQDIDKVTALQLVNKNSAAIGLSKADIENVIVSNAYKSGPLDLVYLQQMYKGLPVFNQLQVLAFKNGLPVSNSGGRIRDIESKSNLLPAFPGVTPQDAVKTAIQSKKGSFPQNMKASLVNGKFDFGKSTIANENITAELMWVPLEDGKDVRLAWQVYFVPKKTSDYWMIRIDANNNEVIGENNLTVYCNWDNPFDKGVNNAKHEHNGQISTPNANAVNEAFNFDNISNSLSESPNSPSIVNTANYKVIPFPAESPKHPGGLPALVNNPWNLAPGNATSLKWHSNGTTDYNTTRGNNVWAQEDANGNNGTGISATSTTSPDPLNFNFTPDFMVSPSQATPIPNQQFNITNLFYWNNIMHDVVYQYGFDEPAGNFQANNQGRGGAGNDYVLADCQDGGGTNNANFSTPADGGSGRMQMYLWSAPSGLLVNTPASIAGNHPSTESAFSTQNLLTNLGPRTGQVVYYNDIAAATHEGCVTPSNAAALSGKIALIIRGNCNFTVKVKNAQNAGAIGVIMVNNIAGDPITMGGTDNTITIPAVMVSNVTGALFANQLANNLNVTLSAGQPIDGDVDNGVIAHEFSHGISGRLTGGPSNPNCLSNAEQMGEGWSDYYSLMITQDWPNSTLLTGEISARGIGTYAIGQTPAGSGIRSQKYCTDFDINNKVYAASIPASAHDRGELWCATLWDMTWNIIKQVNTINPNIYDATGGGGNNIALKLVTEGLKLQPCNPGFIDGRNAILQADQALYGGTYSCAIKEAFRKRGMGQFASQGSSSSVTDQVPDFTLPVSLKVSHNIAQVPEGQNVTYTTTLTSCAAFFNHVLTDTLPANVTYVSGGTYTPATRVVSFVVNQAPGQSQSYSFTVNVNAGSYFTPETLLTEQVAGAAIPASWTASSTTANVWSVSAAQSQSAPNSFFTPNAAVASDQKLETTTAIPLGTGQSAISFSHRYITQDGFDGGVLEISTDNGTTWNDLNNKITAGYYTGTLAAAQGNPIGARRAWTGNAASFINSSVNLSSYTGQSAKFRFRFGSSNATAGTGWYVDDILVKREAVVNIRSNLFDFIGGLVSVSDTVTLITTASCTNVAIATQPANSIACAGTNATFSVTVNGSTPAFQWQVSTDGGATYNPITGANAATLTLTGVTAGMNNNLYQVIITNTCPSNITSAGALLTVNQPAAIATQPTNNTACVGANASFTVTATGTSVTYQWQVSTDGGLTYTNIAGATAATLNLPGVTAAMNGYQYQVILSSCSPGALTSGSAVLTVNNTASISAQPANTSACTGGGDATFTVTGAGSSLSYQWQVSTDGGLTYNPIPGATSATLTLTGITSAMNNNLYNVIVSNTCASSVTSQPALLTVSDPAAITAQPTSTTVCAGDNAAFTVTATGTANTYQWQVSTDGGTTFSDITGQTTNTLNLAAVTGAMDGNIYHLVVTSCSPTGLNSNNVTLTVNSPAAISAQPANTTSCVGNDATFTVTAAGTSLSYQWQVSTDGGVTYNPIAGETAAALTLTAVTAGMSNNLYNVIVTGICPSAITSAGALLTVSNNASIAAQPTNSIACAGNNASFTATASGTSYQWQVSTDGGTSFTDIAGETTTTLNLIAVTAAMNNNQYRLVVFSCTPTGLNSTAAVLTVNDPAAVATQPANTVVCVGADATFTVTATGTSLSYQWQVSTDGGVTYNPIAGATASTLTLTAVTAGMNNNLYNVILSNSCTAAFNSNAATLSITDATVINTQPAATSTCSGTSAGFSVAATGTGLTYQWQVSTDGGASFTNIAGETGVTLSLAAVTDDMNNNQYRAIVFNSCSATGVNSDPATLTVNSLPVVVISAAPYTSLTDNLTTTLTATSTPASASFNWYLGGVLIPAATGNTITVDHDALGDYTASVTDINGCSNTSNLLSIGDSSVSITFIYPNPNTGHFYVRFNGIGFNGQPRIITMYDSKGARVYSKAYAVTTSYEIMEVFMEKLSGGTYMLVLSDVTGKTLATGKVVIL